MLSKRGIACGAVLATMLFASACGGKKVKAAKAPRFGSTETGIASWYGHPYHGRRAANGEVYDMEKLTAAHRTLPFETWVRVQNLSNKRTVDVRIQDRGPFVDGRIIDLSRAAAREIDLLGPGITKVKLTVIAPPRYAPPVKSVEPRETPPATESKQQPTDTIPQSVERQPELFAVQVGAFRDRARAVAVEAQMREKFGAARIVERAGNPPVYRVLVGEHDTIEEAEMFAAEVRASVGPALVVRLDDAAVR